jgi:hypothetical protein
VELLDLPLIGWLFSVCSGIALALGALVVGLYYGRGGARTQARRRVLEDLVLFAIWLLGLAGGIGVLLGKAWSRPALELFCWTLMVLLLMSCWSSLRAAPPPRGTRAVSMALFVVPILAVCFATIVTLRSETAVRVLSG